jgi:hypothetical protein
MGLFEENPIFLVALIVVTVECWSAVKWGLKQVMRGRRRSSLRNSAG